jgi:hypothetical protein
MRLFLIFINFIVTKVAISFDKFKIVHPVIDKAEKDLNHLHEPELTSSSESEDGRAFFFFDFSKTCNSEL